MSKAGLNTALQTHSITENLLLVVKWCWKHCISKNTKANSGWRRVTKITTLLLSMLAHSPDFWSIQCLPRDLSSASSGISVLHLCTMISSVYTSLETQSVPEFPDTKSLLGPVPSTLKRPSTSGSSDTAHLQDPRNYRMEREVPTGLLRLIIKSQIAGRLMYSPCLTL